MSLLDGQQRAVSTKTATPAPPSYTLRAIHAHVGGEIAGDPDVVVVGVNALELAQAGELTFAEQPKQVPMVRQSRAAAIVIPSDFPALDGLTVLRVPQPRVAFVKAMHLFQASHTAETAGVHRHAVVDARAILGEGVTILECAVIRPYAQIGRGTVIESGAHIGEHVVIGQDCFIGPNVVIARGCQIGHRVILHGGTVIGADGFGFVWSEGRHLKVPQLGNVVIEDDVELGANVCVDRATFGSTLIKRGTKVDNLVQIAHNDIVGEHVIMAGQVGLAGSVRVGDRVMFGGQAGVADHTVIGDDAKIGGGSVVFKDVPAGQTMWWYPARPIKRVKEELAALAYVPRLVKQHLSRSKRTKRRTAKP